MPKYAALLRAVNVGGTGKLPMAELRELCTDCGFESIATYIQSGNVVFKTRQPERKVKKALEAALAEHMGKPVGVLVRAAKELEATLGANPFSKAPPNRVLVLFFDRPPPKSSITGIEPPGKEKLALVGRHLFIHYPDGMGKSKLKIPIQKECTGRNLNTVGKLVSMLEELE